MIEHSKLLVHVQPLKLNYPDLFGLDEIVQIIKGQDN